MPPFGDTPEMQLRRQRLHLEAVARELGVPVDMLYQQAEWLAHEKKGDVEKVRAERQAYHDERDRIALEAGVGIEHQGDWKRCAYCGRLMRRSSRRSRMVWAQQRTCSFTCAKSRQALLV